MHVLGVYCHPVETSFHAALHHDVPSNQLPLAPYIERLRRAEANVRPMLTHIKRISAVVTYGRPRWVAWYMGDPPRKGKAMARFA